ncbi:MAG: Gfo/Idh/MocA family oxidoreductase [Planctomycetia bacterium]|nr:Gfo/Idh/MocA family oxidoreductase [Planctomycetia bacterium]
MRMNRRDMLKTSLATGLFLPGISGLAFGDDSPNERVNVALIGIGGQGGHQVGGLASQNVVALCDCDDARAGKVYERLPNAKKYYDFRKMFDEMSNQFDAVAVSTPDHTHFHPSYIAMSLDKHLYLEKPMAHCVKECRILTEMARERKLATQLGMQRHAMPQMRRTIEAIQSGAIGEITEVYSRVGGNRGMPEALKFDTPKPENLDWDVWIGPAKFRPYTADLCPYKWRFWWDYGTGETGNWCCHIMEIPFWALNLTYPEKISATGPEVDAERTSKGMDVVFDFPAVGDRKAVKLYWSHGGFNREIKKHLEKFPNMKQGNNIFIGTKGIISCDFSWHEVHLYDEKAEYQVPEETIPASPGFHREWINAIKGGEVATCNFDYSGKIAEAGLLGNAAYRVGAKDGIRWDWKAIKSPDCAAIDEFNYPNYRKGWEL